MKNGYEANVCSSKGIWHTNDNTKRLAPWKVQRTGNFADNSLGVSTSVAEFSQEHTTQSIRIQGDHMQQSIIN